MTKCRPVSTVSSFKSIGNWFHFVWFPFPSSASTSSSSSSSSSSCSYYCCYHRCCCCCCCCCCCYCWIVNEIRWLGKVRRARNGPVSLSKIPWNVHRLRLIISFQRRRRHKTSCTGRDRHLFHTYYGYLPDNRCLVSHQPKSNDQTEIEILAQIYRCI